MRESMPIAPKRVPDRLRQGPGRLRARVARTLRTVGVRLTLLYSGLFLASGVALLGATYLLASRPISGTFWVSGSKPGAAPGTTSAAAHGVARSLHIEGHLAQQATLHQLLDYSGYLLIGMAVLTLVLGWLVARRVLRPLRTITATTQQINERNLHQRLNLPGPPDELKNLGDTIDGLIARLDDAFEAQRRFVANASHEFRTPLATMRAALDVAEGKPDPIPPQTLTLSRRLRGQLDELDRLLDSFLALARVQHDTTPERTTLAVDDLVGDALDQREAVIADKHLAIRRHGDPRAQLVGNPTLLTRMVANLVDNAVRHNQPDGWITITTTADGTTRRTELVVETGGPVLDPEHVRQLAQPFRRVGADRTGSRSGTGLGLSIVDAIAAAHDGELRLHARPEGGLRVVVDLPLATSVPAGAVV